MAETWPPHVQDAGLGPNLNRYRPVYLANDEVSTPSRKARGIPIQFLHFLQEDGPPGPLMISNGLVRSHFARNRAPSRMSLCC